MGGRQGKANGLRSGPKGTATPPAEDDNFSPTLAAILAPTDPALLAAARRAVANVKAKTNQRTMGVAERDSGPQLRGRVRDPQDPNGFLWAAVEGEGYPGIPKVRRGKRPTTQLPLF